MLFQTLTSRQRFGFRKIRFQASTSGDDFERYGRPQLALTSRQRFVLKVTPSGANIFSSVNGFKLRVIQAHTDIEDGKKNWKSLQKYTSLMVCFNMCIVAALAAASVKSATREESYTQTQRSKLFLFFIIVCNPKTKFSSNSGVSKLGFSRIFCLIDSTRAPYEQEKNGFANFFVLAKIF